MVLGRGWTRVLLVYWGTTSQQLVAWMDRHAVAAKLAMAVPFLLLAAWLVAGILAL